MVDGLIDFARSKPLSQETVVVVPHELMLYFDAFAAEVMRERQAVDAPPGEDPAAWEHGRRVGEVLERVFESLEPFEVETQRRIIKAACILLGIEEVPF